MATIRLEALGQAPCYAGGGAASSQAWASSICTNSHLWFVGHNTQHNGRCAFESPTNMEASSANIR